MASNAGEAAQALAEIIEEETRGLDDVGKRIVANRLHVIIEPWRKLSETREVIRKAGPPLPEGLTPMTKAEAESFGKQRIMFRKYQGQMYREVPVSYLRWIADLCRRTWRDLTRYVASETVRIQELQQHEHPSQDEIVEETDPAVQRDLFGDF